MVNKINRFFKSITCILLKNHNYNLVIDTKVGHVNPEYMNGQYIDGLYVLSHEECSRCYHSINCKTDYFLYENPIKLIDRDKFGIKSYLIGNRVKINFRNIKCE